MKQTSNRYIIPILIFILSFIILLKTLCPTIFPGDSGELVTSSYTLGIAHPPGYPLWVILTKLGSLIIPFGSISFRANLVNATFLAITNLFIYLIVFRLSKSSAGATLASLGAGFSEIIWSQGISSEVYTLNAILFAALIYFSILIVENKDYDKRLLMIVIFLSALSIANHHTVFLVIPFLWLYIFVRNKQILTDWKIIIPCMFIFLLGLSIYLQLSVRASVPGISQWSNPETLNGFIFHVARKVYGNYQQNAYSLQLLAKQTKTFIFYIINQGKFLIIILFLLGIYTAFKKDSERISPPKKRTIYLLIILFFSCSIGINLIINTRVNPLKLFLIEVMYIPSVLILYIFAGLSLAFFKKSGNIKIYRYASLLYIGCTVLLFIFSYHPSDASNNFIAYNYGIDQVKSADSNSSIIIEGDIQLFPLVYLQNVEGYRQDLMLIDRTGSLGNDIYNFEKVNYKTPDSLETYREKIEIDLLDEFHSLFYTEKKAFSVDSGHVTIPQGFLYKVIRNNDKHLPYPENCFSYRTWNIDSKSVYLDYFSENILSKLYMSVGETLAYSGYDDHASKYLEYAASHANIAKEAHNNLAVIYENMGKYSESLKEYEKALKTDPENDVLYFNMGNLNLKLNRKVSAEKFYTKAHELKPHSDRYLLALGNIHTSLGQYDKAESELLKSLKINPDNYDANLLLGDLTKRKGQYNVSERYYKKSLSLEPDNPKPYNNLAGLYVKMDSINDAIEYYEKAYDADNSYLLPLFNLGVIYYKNLKDVEKAKFYWQKFLDESKPDELSTTYSRERDKLKKIMEAL